MKKLLSLVLALALALSLGSVALAFEWDFCTERHWSIFEDGGVSVYAPGSELLASDRGIKEEVKNTLRISSEWEKGGALVESLKWDVFEDNWFAVMTLKPNYTIEDGKELVGKVELIDRATGTVHSVVYFGLTAMHRAKVANGVEEVQGAAKAEDAEEYSITGIERNHIIYKCDEDAPGYVKFNSGGASLLQITAKMNRNEKLHLYLVEDDDDILTALSDLGIDPEAVTHTYTLEGAVPFQNPARHTLQADYAEQYHIYAFDGKNLTEVKAEWNSQEGVYEWWATAMTTYVISDRELKLPDPEADPKTEG